MGDAERSDVPPRGPSDPERDLSALRLEQLDELLAHARYVQDARLAAAVRAELRRRS